MGEKNHLCNITFRLESAFQQIDTISCAIIQGHRVFVGSESGYLYKYKLRKHIHRDKNTNFKTKLEKSTLVVKNHPIVQIVIQEALNYIIVLCAGTIKIYNLGDLSHVRDIPFVKDVSSFCCNTDGHPLHGICISARHKLILYDLQDINVNSSKVLIVPEPPKTIRWLRKYLCLGFATEYSIVPFNGDNPKGLLSVTNVPIIEVLPTEELVMANKNTAVFAYASRRKSRESLRFKSTPQKFAFCFPFLVSVGNEVIEVLNIMDYHYHFIIKKPFDVISLSSDGKDIIVVGPYQVLYLLPSSADYCIKDPVMFLQVKKNPSDKALFVRYINYVLREPKNPFKQLLVEFADKFVTKFRNPEEADLKIVKKYLDIALRKLNRVLIIHIKKFQKKVWCDLLFSTLQTIFYSRIYWLLFAMMTTQYKNQDILSFEKTSTYKDITPGHLGAQKRFWLTKESFDDPPPKKQPPSEETHETSTNNEDDISAFQDDNDVSFLSYTEEFLSPRTMDVPVNTTEPIRTNNIKVSTNKFKDAVSPSLQEIFLATEKATINADVVLYILDDPLSTSGGRLLGKGILMNDEDENLFIKLANEFKLFYIVPSNMFSYHRDTFSISWQQKELHYKMKFEEPFIYEDVVKKLIFLQKNMREATGKTDELMDNYILKALSEDEQVDDFSDDSHSNYHRKKLLDSNSSATMSSSSQPESPLSSGSFKIVEKGLIPPFYLPADGSDATPSSSPSSKPSSFNDDDLSLTFEQTQPYHSAIKTLRKISLLKSPRDKLGCILQTFKDIIQCVGDFWESYDREAVVGADDLVPIFAYVILKARIPKIFSEMNFIWEFATDSEMNGKYGYGFATFQIGVEIITGLDDSIWNTLEKETAKERRMSKHNIALPKKIETNPPEDHYLSGGILEKRDMLVSQRVRANPSDNDEEE